MNHDSFTQWTIMQPLKDDHSKELIMQNIKQKSKMKNGLHGTLSMIKSVQTLFKENISSFSQI